MKGYKVFDPDWKCSGFQFEVGKTFEEDVEPECCERGFHFCTKASDCFNYYGFDTNNKVAEVEAVGDIDAHSNDTKCSTNKLHIIREITWQEVLELVNFGKACTGLCNSGDWNSGDYNSGDCNSGNRNSGDWNTGDWNTGNRNTGDWNSTNFSSGCFNTEEQKIMLFNKPSDWTYRKWLNSDARYLLNRIDKNVVEWVDEPYMSDEEKEAHPTYECTDGYLKVLDESECGQIWWDGLSETKKAIIKAIPNFDADKFEKCTGIKVGD